MALLTDEEIQQELKTLHGWEWDGDTIEKQYSFGSFAESMAFANRVAGLAEAQNHHPDILVQYAKVTLITSSHDVGGLTARDFKLAKAIDAWVPRRRRRRPARPGAGASAG
jgi:4a-hydroxytetrahydrobiopterin dehydratase